MEPCQVQLIRSTGAILMGPGTPYTVLPEWDPWSRTARDEQSRPRPYAHGSVAGSEWMDEAVVLIPVSVHREQSTKADWMAAHQRLAAAFTAVGATGEVCELHFEWGGTEYVMFGRPRPPRVMTDNVAVGKSVEQCAFVAADPRIYSAAESVLSTALPSQRGGLTISPGQSESTTVAIVGEAGFAEESDPAIAQSVDAPGRGLVVCAWTSWSEDAGYVPPGSMTVAVQASGEWASHAVATEPIAAAGPTGPREATLGSADAWSAVAVAIAGSVTVVSAHTAYAHWTDPPPEVTTVPAEAGWWMVAIGAVDEDGSGLLGPPSGGGWEQVTGTPPTSDASRTVAWARQVTAPGPQTITIESAGTDTFLTVLLLSPPTARGGLTVPFTVPGVPVGGRLDLVNEGTAPAGLTARIDGPVVEPGIVLQTPGSIQSIRFNMALDAGQWLDIDSTTRTAFLNGHPTANRRPNATWQMDTHPVPPGSTTARFLAGDHSAAARLTVSIRSAWW